MIWAPALCSLVSHVTGGTIKEGLNSISKGKKENCNKVMCISTGTWAVRRLTYCLNSYNNYMYIYIWKQKHVYENIVKNSCLFNFNINFSIILRLHNRCNRHEEH